MFEEYLKGNSIVHKLDPRIKLIFAVLLSIVIALSNSFYGIIIGLSTGILLLIIARIEFKQIIKRLIVVNEFILLLWLILPFTCPGNPVLKIFGLAVTDNGIRFTLFLTLKSNSIVLILISLVSTSSIFEIVHALRHLLIPDKLVVLFFLIYRYSWVIFYEYEKIKKAIKARGFKPKTSIHTYRTFAYLIGGLLVKSYIRGENVHKAMVSRGFAGKFWLLDHFRFKFSDALACIILTVWALLIVLIS
ncbi:MAG: cobalt ECF transporter T component CbiQ [candidate division WOR-3 bacterium]